MNSIVGDVNVVNALLFGGTSPTMRAQIEQEHQSFVQRMTPVWGSQMLQRTKDVFNSFNGVGVMQMVDKALNSLNAQTKPDAIFSFKTLEDFQSAKPMMQSYIMANPVIRAAYHRGTIDGYSETYVDPSPGIIGFGHHAYMHVMDGVMQGVNADGSTSRLKDLTEESSVQFTNYSAAHIGADQMALDVVAKGKVLNSWLWAEKLFEGDDDVSNAFGVAE